MGIPPVFCAISEGVTVGTLYAFDAFRISAMFGLKPIVPS